MCRDRLRQLYPVLDRLCERQKASSPEVFDHFKELTESLKRYSSAGELSDFLRIESQTFAIMELAPRNAAESGNSSDDLNEAVFLAIEVYRAAQACQDGDLITCLMRIKSVLNFQKA